MIYEVGYEPGDTFEPLVATPEGWQRGADKARIEGATAAGWAQGANAAALLANVRVQQPAATQDKAEDKTEKTNRTVLVVGVIAVAALAFYVYR
ncbi:MAG: hypothetical protein CMM76_17515 [Rhodospirillaceae bacterium]|nr:hypothetical protein [Rhodospirillaceae bacterium]|tara:strand:+ start:4643 stop:4924 length:282 start_codon:yes stop_codon:yes gene_type:complete